MTSGIFGIFTHHSGVLAAHSIAPSSLIALAFIAIAHGLRMRTRGTHGINGACG